MPEGIAALGVSDDLVVGYGQVRRRHGPVPGLDELRYVATHHVEALLGHEGKLTLHAPRQSVVIGVHAGYDLV